MASPARVCVSEVGLLAVSLSRGVSGRGRQLVTALIEGDEESNGACRIWEVAGAEFWVTPVFWPDFGEEHLLEAIAAYQQRGERKDV